MWCRSESSRRSAEVDEGWEVCRQTSLKYTVCYSSNFEVTVLLNAYFVSITSHMTTHQKQEHIFTNIFPYHFPYFPDGCHPLTGDFTCHKRQHITSAVAAVTQTRSAVSVRIACPPQFWISVRGITSRARDTARYGHCWMPVMCLAFSFNTFTSTHLHLTVFTIYFTMVSDHPVHTHG